MKLSTIKAFKVIIAFIKENHKDSMTIEEIHRQINQTYNINIENCKKILEVLNNGKLDDSAMVPLFEIYYNKKFAMIISTRNGDLSDSLKLLELLEIIQEYEEV
jgi:hypothetical protein